jgi:putative membrane protein
MQATQLLKSWTLIALGVLIASNTAQGIHYDSGAALMVTVLLLSLLNVFLKPLLLLFSLPLIVLSFGLGIWMINALLFLIAGGLVEGFHVYSFSSALWGSLVVSITSGIANLLFGTQPRARAKVNVQFRGTGPTTRHDATQTTPKPKPRNSLQDDDVIDI